MEPSLLDPAQNSTRPIQCADNIAGDVERCEVVYVSMRALIFQRLELVLQSSEVGLFLAVFIKGTCSRPSSTSETSHPLPISTISRRGLG